MRAMPRPPALVIVACALLLSASCRLAAGETAGPQPAAKRAALVEIDAAIDANQARYLKRALADARAAKVDAVVVHLTTPGGRLDAAEEMTKAALAMPDDGPELVAFVDRSSYSAGSLIAYSHRRIYLTDAATVGDIGVIFIGADGKMEYAPEKAETVVRALLRSAAQKNGWDPAKLQKMTARNQSLYRCDLPGGPVWVIEDDLATFLAAHPDFDEKKKIEILGEDRLLSYTAKEAVAEKMATALVKDLDEVYRALGVPAAGVLDLRPTTNERLSWLLGGWAPLLAAAAVLFLILEFKTPGLGIWLTLAVICGGLFFLCQFYLELANYLELSLVIAGVALVLVELFLLPTGGFLAAGGAALAIAGLVLAFMPDARQFSPGMPGWSGDLAGALGSSLLALTVIAVGVAMLIAALPHMRAMRRIAATGEITATSGDGAPAVVGRQGVARSDLTPAGFVLIDGREHGATSEHGEFVRAGTPVEVIAMSFGEAVVRPLAGAPGAERPA
jgi:membrane-bound serine protease (ClpP class)